MGAVGAAEDFAAYLRVLKERSGRSYAVLAARLHLSTSTLHRYCHGKAVPVEYGSVERLARLCGATRGELLELHRLWVRADALRGQERPADPPDTRAATAARPGPEPAREPEPEAEAAREPEPEAESAREPEPVRAPEPEPEAARDRAPEAAPGPESRPEPQSEPQAAPQPDATPALSAAQESPPRTGSEPSPGSRLGRRAVWPVAAVCTVVLLVVIAAALRDPGSAPSADDRAAPTAGGATHHGGVPDAGPTTSPSTPDGDPPKGNASRTPNATPSEGSGGGAREPGSAAPLTANVRSHVWQDGCGHRYLVDRPPSRVPAPPVAQDAENWANSLGAVHGDSTIVEATVRAADSAPVVVEAVHIRVVARSSPLAWSAFAMSNGCGGALDPAAYTVDLDAARPVARPRDGFDANDGESVPATRLPYRVTPGDPLALRVEARTAEYDCEWYIELEWSTAKRSGTLRIGNGDAPFRTSGTRGGDPPYHYYENTDPGGWRRGQ